ncbi:glycosyltransferase [Vibrio tritonius]|uniref:glycosyltransferase n=1 Tax=Vibrio tritonius TaxID=1435069 RepID=UPI001E4876D8|nr:glycosyltransferase [Vibrio tritonius]
MIMLINTLCKGGAERVVTDLFNRFHNEGYPCDLVTLESVKDNPYTLSKNNIHTLSNSSTNRGIINFIKLPILAFRLSKLIKNNNVNVVQSHLYRANYVNILAKILFRSKHKAQIFNHSITSRFYNEGLSGKINLFLVKLLYKFADEIYGVSSRVNIDINEVLPYTVNEMTKVISNPVSIKKAEMLGIVEPTKFIFSSNLKYICVVGRLIKIKRFNDVVSSMRFLPDNVNLIIIGDGPEHESIKNLASNLGLLDRVHFVGWVNNPYSFISRCLCLVCSSESESFGNVIIESYACGVPVISSRCGGPEEIIDDEFGLLFDIGNVKQLSDNIKIYLNNEEVRLEHINSSKDKISKYDEDVVFDEYKKALFR